MTCRSSRFLIKPVYLLTLVVLPVSFTAYLFGARHLLTVPSQHGHHTQPLGHERVPSLPQNLSCISQTLVATVILHAHSLAACAYSLRPICAIGCLMEARANLVLPATVAPCAGLLAPRLLTQSVHIVRTGLFCPVMVHLGTGEACRERVLSPRRASDDVIFGIRRESVKAHWRDKRNQQASLQHCECSATGVSHQKAKSRSSIEHVRDLGS